MTVIGIFGPTASGKTRVAAALAERLPAELVSADAMQVYRGLPILTNQAPARLVALWPLDHEASVGEYAPLAQAAIDEILAAGRTPIVVGGTGLYLRAALADLALPAAPAPGGARALGAVYDEDPARRPRAAHRARSGGRGRRPPKRPPPRRARPRARRAPAHRSRRRRTASGPRRPATRPCSSASTSRRTCSSGGSRSAPARCSMPASSDEVQAALAGPISRDRPEDARPRRGGDAAARGGDRGDRRADAPLRRISAQVDAARARPRYGRCGSPAGRDRR